MSTAKPRGKRIALFCLTPGGKALAEKIRPLLPATCYTSEKLVSEALSRSVTALPRPYSRHLQRMTL